MHSHKMQNIVFLTSEPAPIHRGPDESEEWEPSSKVEVTQRLKP